MSTKEKYVERIEADDEVENLLRSNAVVPGESPLERFDTAVEIDITIADTANVEIIIEIDEESTEKHLENTPKKAILHHAKSNSKESQINRGENRTNTR